MFNSTNIYTKEYEHGRTSMIYDRSTISGWTVEVINMYDEEQFVGIFRTTLRDGKECEQFTLLPSRYSDDTFIQIRIYKNGDVLVYGLVPVNTVVFKRKKLITIELFCNIEIDESGNFNIQMLPGDH